MDHRTTDITNFSQLEQSIQEIKPDVVINFAGITDLNTCESERKDITGSAWQVNVVGTTNLSKLSTQYAFHLIQISTASVFSGEKSNPGPYLETSVPESDSSKLSWYGITKLEAEKSVKSIATSWSIIRLSSGVRSSIGSKPCLFRRWLEQYQNNSLQKLFSDQQMTITDLTELDLCLTSIIEKKLSGILHISSSDLISPYDLGKELLSKWKNQPIEPTATALLTEIENNPKLKLFCPQYWGLDSTQTAEKLGYTFKSTSQIIEEFIIRDLK